MFTVINSSNSINQTLTFHHRARVTAYVGITVANLIYLCSVEMKRPHPGKLPPKEPLISAYFRTKITSTSPLATCP